jgi:hypothetical protein
MVIYEEFVERGLEAPAHFARTVHDLCFGPKQEEIRPRTVQSLSNAVTSPLNDLEPIPQFGATSAEAMSADRSSLTSELLAGYRCRPIDWEARMCIASCLPTSPVVIAGISIPKDRDRFLCFGASR